MPTRHPSHCLSRASLTGAALLSLCLALPAAAQVAPAPVADPVVLTFATVGDSRQDPATAGLSGQDAHWLQNSKAFSRILREVGKHKASMLVFNGDMIMGYGNAALPASLPATAEAYMATDLAKNYTQYAFWRGMVATAMETGTYIVPVPGNHEVQCSTKVNASCPSANGGKNALEANEKAWRANMGDLILDSARFAGIVGSAPANFSLSNTPCVAGGTCTDGITTDQTQLSYSYDVGNSHFTVINTDAPGRDSHAPVQWMTSDLAAAKSRGAKNFFVFGHKPAYSYFYVGSDVNKKSGLDVDAAGATAFWDVIEQYGATYFSGHEHVFNAMQPRGSAWQVLVGSGGSPFDAAVAGVPTDRMYAYAVVHVHQSGKVRIDAFGFPTDFSASQKVWSVKLAH